MGRYVLKENKLIFDEDAVDFEEGKSALDYYNREEVCVGVLSFPDGEVTLSGGGRDGDLYVDEKVINGDLFNNDEFGSLWDSAWETIAKLLRSLEMERSCDDID